MLPSAPQSVPRRSGTFIHFSAPLNFCWRKHRNALLALSCLLTWQVYSLTEPHFYKYSSFSPTYCEQKPMIRTPNKQRLLLLSLLFFFQRNTVHGSPALQRHPAAPQTPGLTLMRASWKGCCRICNGELPSTTRALRSISSNAAMPTGVQVRRLVNIW